MPSVPSKFLPNNSVISVWLGALFSVASKVCNETIFAIAGNDGRADSLGTEVNETWGIGNRFIWILPKIVKTCLSSERTECSLLDKLWLCEPNLSTRRGCQELLGGVAVLELGWCGPWTSWGRLCPFKPLLSSPAPSLDHLSLSSWSLLRAGRCWSHLRERAEEASVAARLQVMVMRFKNPQDPLYLGPLLLNGSSLGSISRGVGTADSSCEWKDFPATLSSPEPLNRRKPLEFSFHHSGCHIPENRCSNFLEQELWNGTYVLRVTLSEDRDQRTTWST